MSALLLPSLSQRVVGTGIGNIVTGDPEQTFA